MSENNKHIKTYATQDYVNENIENNKVIINVKDFNAIGNGIADDTVAFQNAINSCMSENKSLFVPSGLYKITSPLTGFNYMTIFGEGRTSELLLDLQDNEYCFDAFSDNQDTGWTYSLIIEKLAFGKIEGASKNVGAIRISNSLRGCTIKDIYSNDILHPFYFGPNLWGNINIENIHAYMIDFDDPTEEFSEDCLAALTCCGNAVRISNIDIVGGFAKGVELKDGNSIVLENSNIAGSDLTLFMKRPITINNVNCAEIRNIYTENPDPAECEGETVNGVAPMIRVMNSTKINIESINLGQGSIYFNNSNGKILNINYGQYAGGLRLQNNSDVIANLAGVGFWDKDRDFQNCNGSVKLIEDTSICENILKNPNLLNNKDLPFNDITNNSENDLNIFETGDRSIKFNVDSTMEWGYLVEIPLHNDNANEIYTIHVRIKKDSGVNSLVITNKGTTAFSTNKYPYTENFKNDNEWYDISYVVKTNEPDASVYLKGESNSTGSFWIDRINVYKGYTGNFKNENILSVENQYVSNLLMEPDYNGIITYVKLIEFSDTETGTVHAEALISGVGNFGYPEQALGILRVSGRGNRLVEFTKIRSDHVYEETNDNVEIGYVRNEEAKTTTVYIKRAIYDGGGSLSILNECNCKFETNLIVLNEMPEGYMSGTNNNLVTKEYVDDNKGLNHITGTEENPIILTDLDIGIYEIDGKLKTYPDSTSLKTVYNGLIVVERKDASISKGIYSYNGLIYSFSYTVSANVFIENKFVKDEEVLTRTNTSDFTPTGDYHPATKKYVDDSIPSIDGLATETYVNNAVSEIVNSAPETLNTLNELAQALGDDPNFATTIANQIGQKADTSVLNNYALKTEIPTVTNDLTNELKANYDAAYTHSQAAHAPSDAQKNSDITKEEIEAKLTGNIGSHTHDQYLTEVPSDYATQDYVNNKLANLQIVQITKTDYDALTTKDPNTLYLIVG